jgi:hypothetical protein
VQDFKTSLCSLPSERPASLMTCGQAPRAALSGSTEVSTDFLIRNLKVGPRNDALPIGSTDDIGRSFINELYGPLNRSKYSLHWQAQATPGARQLANICLTGLRH